jgi:hypothetical protein
MQACDSERLLSRSGSELAVHLSKVRLDRIAGEVELCCQTVDALGRGQGSQHAQFGRSQMPVAEWYGEYIGHSREEMLGTRFRKEQLEVGPWNGEQGSSQSGGGEEVHRAQRCFPCGIVLVETSGSSPDGEHCRSSVSRRAISRPGDGSRAAHGARVPPGKEIHAGSRQFGSPVTAETPECVRRAIGLAIGE